MDKEKIKAELVDKSNNILAKYAEQDIVETISVMNMSAKTVFLGSLRVYNEDVVGDMIKDLKKELKGLKKEDGGKSMQELKSFKKYSWLISAILALIVMLFGLTACGKKEEKK